MEHSVWKKQDDLSGFSAGTTQKVVVHLLSNRIFWKRFVNVSSVAVCWILVFTGYVKRKWLFQ